jgi:hypothetical protein
VRGYNSISLIGIVSHCHTNNHHNTAMDKETRSRLIQQSSVEYHPGMSIGVILVGRSRCKGHSKKQTQSHTCNALAMYTLRKRLISLKL